MKLVYIYIEDHNVIKQIGIKFSSSHQINQNEQEINISYNNTPLNYYYGIQSTAVIGKNGTGKSTLLDFIESSYHTTDSSGFFIWFDNKQCFYHVCLVNYELNENKISFDFPFKIHSDYKTFISKHKIRLIKSNNLSGNESSTISKKSRKNSFSHDLSLAQYKSGSASKLAIRIARLMHFFSNSTWVLHQKDITVKFEFLFKQSSTTYLKNILLKNPHEFSSEEISRLKHMTESRPVFLADSIADPQIPLLNELIRANLLSILRHATKQPQFSDDLQSLLFSKLLIGYVTGTINISDPHDINDVISNSGLYKNINLKGIVNIDAMMISKRFNDVIDVITKISDLITRNTDCIDTIEHDKFVLNQPKVVVELMLLISDLPSNVVSNFNYGWKGFSTGEFAKLNIFSELYYYINDVKRSSSESHLIVMDEVDLYLHPDWQREFLSDTLSFISSEYPTEQVQLILTSHSPIIIGDFLPDDIVSLHREPGLPPKITESFGFGTQILQLYLDGMHLDSTFGKHSKVHIDDILKNKFEKKQTDYNKFLISKIKDENIKKILSE
ncbi:AAA family ATPase [Aeromonas hydrophila]|uniref:AAA family ATPase n=1 Tax=Aeromonas hydrophila TaxID=644 RepID=UPI00164FE7E4|nr:AAA family ATPase [Aeromonas hydrophila]